MQANPEGSFDVRSVGLERSKSRYIGGGWLGYMTRGGVVVTEVMYPIENGTMTTDSRDVMGILTKSLLHLGSIYPRCASIRSYRHNCKCTMYDDVPHYK